MDAKKKEDASTEKGALAWQSSGALRLP